MDSIPGGEDTDKVRCLDSCFQHLGTPTGRNRSLLIKTAALEGELYYSFCFLEPTLGGGVLVDKLLRLNTKICLVMCGLSIRISH